MNIDSSSYSTITSVNSTNGQRHITGETNLPVNNMATTVQTMSQGLARAQGLIAGLQSSIPKNQAISRSTEDLAAAAALLNLSQLAADLNPCQSALQPAHAQQQTIASATNDDISDQTSHVFIDIPDDVSTSSTVSELTNPRYSRTLIDKEYTPPSSPSP